jgi:glycosyltransferase involved in cell wall biosynthesis
MRVLMVSKALVVGMYQRKLEELAAQPDVDLTVAVPPYWRERGHDWRLERSFCRGYDLRVLPMRLNGHYHVHYYPGLARLLDRVKPEVLHFDEEPYNLSTWLAVREARRRDIPAVIFCWQNILRRYPPPFRWMEGQVLRNVAYCQAGSHAAVDVLRAKGYRGPVEVLPQFGIDPALFRPSVDRGGNEPRPFTIGFVGRLVPEKGLSVLLDAVTGLRPPWRLVVVGSGPGREEYERRARELGIGDRVEFKGQVPSTGMPEVMRTFDVLAGPSLTLPNWKEQFGRMLVEAMACEVPVVGSDSGEIPAVIGDAGLITPEGDAPALRDALRRLQDDPAYRLARGRAGRQRVLALYTQQAVAARTAVIYRRVLGLLDEPIPPVTVEAAEISGTVR